MFGFWRRRGKQENECRFISSRGILKSVELHTADPESDAEQIPADLAKRLKGEFGTLYLSATMIPDFIENYLPSIRSPFVLVTGDADIPLKESSFPEGYMQTLLDHPLIIRWYAQNLDTLHPKLVNLPLGVDYHTLSSKRVRRKGRHSWGRYITPELQEEMICRIGHAAGPLANKKPIAFSNWHFVPERGNRQACLDEADRRAVYYQEKFIPRMESWELNSTFAFTLSPHGNGLDCHRTWEAYLLGTIPVVTTSSLDPLYEGLPVVILKDWAELSQQRLEEELEVATRTSYDFSRLELSYWAAKILGKDLDLHPCSFEAFRETLVK
ncbi:hypothetical protein [Roseibium suaedae]|uniref:Exostosin GT47 domain-containing protein n=1 Tax=Roseibium suaedae TaxID=735517 RepID=A0A1M7GPX4_9HYPH|nr:hypothetical protein [Roseibium suaedae]SHM18245.1 hypothetical protein SAMN05444272_1984 [Roseibium suaedae]